MKFSVIIPVYLAQETILETLHSVLSQLGPNDEVLLVDDASPDRSMEKIQSVEDPRLRVFSHATNQGIGAARNTALAQASGDYILFLDADDLWPQDRHAHLVSLLQTHQPDIISGAVKHFYCPSLSETERLAYKLPETQAGIIPGTTVIQANLRGPDEYFDVSLKVGEFIDFFCRLKTKSKRHLQTDAVLLERRIHRNNHTLRQRHQQADYLKIIRRHLNREFT